MLSSAADRKQERAAKQRALVTHVLVADYLKGKRYEESYDAFCKEALDNNIPIQNFKLCDNVDLGTVLMDCEHSYSTRYDRQPSFIKPRDSSAEFAELSIGRQKETLTSRLNKRGRQKAPSLSKPHINAGDASQTEGLIFNLFEDALQDRMVSCTTLHSSSFMDAGCDKDRFPRLSDIKGLDDVKRVLIESIVLPSKCPTLFKGILSPWRGVLLTGPPGNGKTMTAKAFANEYGITFVNASPSMLVSKWRGESEKLVRALFDRARDCAPSVIFFDEFDCLMTTRGDQSEHESSRRMKAELLTQMDALEDEAVFVVAATNMPWDLDTAIVRRLEKRVIIDNPDLPLREDLLKMFLSKQAISDRWELEAHVNFSQLAAKVDGYSTSDIKVLCREAIMQFARPLFAQIEKNELSGKRKLGPLTTADFVKVLEYVKPSCCEKLVARYREWIKQYGVA